MLGEVQHGHMEQVGYDTYCKLLDEVMKETQGIQVQEEKRYTNRLKYFKLHTR